MHKRILLIRTGGTIDAQPYDDVCDPPFIVDPLKGENSLIMGAIEGMENHQWVEEYHWWARNDKGETIDTEKGFVKDSQKFTPQDMMALAQIIREDDRRFFVLTHGTDKMAQNARMLKKLLAGTDKVVAFTGAMVPLSMSEQRPSDGIPGLAYTLATIEGQGAGVYMVARDAEGKLGFHNPDKVDKDKSISCETWQFTVKSRDSAAAAPSLS